MGRMNISLKAIDMSVMVVLIKTCFQMELM